MSADHNGDFTPVDKVIKYIQEAITNKEYLPGDRLPAERKLSEILGVGRPHIRKAIQKLEMYGIVRTMPQSGTFIAAFSKEQMENMVSETLKVSKYDFYSLVYVRVLLEIEVCKLAAKNRTEEDLKAIEEAVNTWENNSDEKNRVSNDFAIHKAIARSSHNPVLSSLLSIVTPDIMKYYHRFQFCISPERMVITEHREFLEKIRQRDVDGMKELVLRHLHNLILFAREKAGKEVPNFNFEGIE